MEWAQVLAVAAINIGLIAWLRSDTKTFQSEIRSELKGFQECLKDFHGRLCALEEKYAQMMQRFLEKK